MAAKPPDIPWMPAPQAPSGCPPGLEYLSQIDQLLVHQQVELLEGKRYKHRSAEEGVVLIYNALELNAMYCKMLHFMWAVEFQVSSLIRAQVQNNENRST